MRELASIIAIRGARSSNRSPAKEVLLEPVEVQATEGHLGLAHYVAVQDAPNRHSNEQLHSLGAVWGPPKSSCMALRQLADLLKAWKALDLWLPRVYVHVNP